jgi:hypothetical protein
VSESTTQRIAAILAAYWWGHPAACDTPEGIRQWWLGAQTDVSLGELEEALRWMLDRGLIEQRLTGERSLFRLRADADPAGLQELAAKARDARP